MHLSIKQKQVLGVTSMVAVMVVALSLLHLMRVARVLLEESRARAETAANTIYHHARDVVTSRDTAYAEWRSSRSVRSALESALYAPDIMFAAIVDRDGAVVAADDPATDGQLLPPSPELTRLLAGNGLAQLLAVYESSGTFEWRQPMALGDEPVGEIRVGLSTTLLRRELLEALRPAALVALVALLVAVLVATLLAQWVVRPIHVIASSLSRLGRGDLGVTLDLRDEEFRDLGDVFDRLSARLQTSGPQGVKPAEIADLSRRVAAMGRLTAGVAHEVKNPLNAMAIHLELLKQKLASPKPAAAAGHAEVIDREIKRLDDVVQGFLKFVRPEDVTFAPVRVAALAGSVVDAVAPEAAAAGVSVERAFGDTMLSVAGDETLLRQALLNLARNAIQATPAGGRLRVACGARDDRVEIRVEDTGAGIPPENLPKIFDLYFTTRERGSGIGLSMVYRTIQLHNGDIDVESTVGTGTTFVIKLPRAA
jgi:signal transduction histidine kinase